MENRLQFNNILVNNTNHDICNFIGDVYKFIEENYILDLLKNKNYILFYYCGDVSKIPKEYKNIVHIIEEYSFNFCNSTYKVIKEDSIPRNINGGMFIKKIFDENYYDDLLCSHNFSNLTESDKDSIAYRDGVYLSNVKQVDDKIFYNLLRCSTNFSTPTENFKEVDKIIIGKVQYFVDCFFEKKVKLNHVLAQRYNNIKIKEKEKKAKIKAHSDKTKDMPKEGVIAFVSFYDKDSSNQNHYSKLRFKVKKQSTSHNHVKTFDVILYPGSVYVIPLTINREYTHEIIPSDYSIDKIPTRIGYTIRTSNVEACYDKGSKGAYIKKGKLTNHSEEFEESLKNQYLIENTTTDIVQYDETYFTMNQGDLLEPIL